MNIFDFATRNCELGRNAFYCHFPLNIWKILDKSESPLKIENVQFDFNINFLPKIRKIMDIGEGPKKQKMHIFDSASRICESF